MVFSSIWNYLIDLVKFNGSTIIITTHYMDEARFSNKVERQICVCSVPLKSMHIQKKHEWYFFLHIFRLV